MAWEINSVENQRKLLVEAYLTGEEMTTLCHKYNISRKTAYKWVDRYRSYGETGLGDRSRAPLKPNRTYEQNIIQRAIDLKLEHIKWGPRKILARLQRDFPRIDWPSESRLYEIFKEKELVIPRRVRHRVAATHPLGEINASNDVWSIDFKGWCLLPNGAKWEPLTITDGYSRYLIKCEQLKIKSSEYVWDVLANSFKEYGLPLRIRSDNGPPFGSVGIGRLTELSVKLIQAGVTPEWINPGHPEENPRHERFHLTLQEYIASPPAATLEEQNKRVAYFKEEYNFDRPHEGLNMGCPGDFYQKSPRDWDGKLRSPEYVLQGVNVRKVGKNGCIWIRQKEFYLSHNLSGEYVGLNEVEDGTKVFYGPVFLAKISNEGIFERPNLEPEKIVRRR